MKKYLTHLKVESLGGDKIYQRSIHWDKINKWAQNYRPELLEPLIVSKRPDESYVVICGQHRTELLKKINAEVAPCMVFEGLTIQQEAELFYKYEEEKIKHTSIEKFIAKIVSEEPHEIKVSEILNKNGFYLDREKAKNKKISGRVNCVVSVSKLSKVFGYGVLDETLKLINKVWSNDCHATEKIFIEAIAKFIIMFYNNENFIISRALQQFKMINPADTIMRARGMKLSGKTSDNIVTMLIDVYNQRLHIQKRIAK